MTKRSISKAMAGAAALAVLAALPAWAGAIRVSANGTDSATCGIGAEAPCATISQAVANAADGDSIAVGAGSYAGTTVNKSVSLSSSSGTGGAIITSAMSLAANGIRFGKSGGGFSLAGPLTAVTVAGDEVVVRGNLFSNCTTGVEVTSGSDDVVRDNSFNACSVGVSVVGATATLIRGNRFGYTSASAVVLASGSSAAIVRENRTYGPSGNGFAIAGSDHLLWRNLVHGTPGGGFLSTGPATNVELRENLIVSGGAPGFNLTTGSGWILDANAVVNNSGPGFYLATGTTIVATDNVASGNNSQGFIVVGGNDHVLEGNSAIQNNGSGIVLATVGTGTHVTGGNLYGNADNCGLYHNSANVVTSAGVYWGDGAGPGLDPADALCGNTAVITVESFADTPAKIKMPGIK